MKKGDIGAIVFLVIYAGLVLFFPWTVTTRFSFEKIAEQQIVLGNLSEGLKNFGTFTASFPYLMGFLKVGLLATFGEMLKTRIKTGSWKVPSLFARFMGNHRTCLHLCFCFVCQRNCSSDRNAVVVWQQEFGKSDIRTDTSVCVFHLILDEYDFCLSDDARS